VIGDVSLKTKELEEVYVISDLKSKALEHHQKIQTEEQKSDLRTVVTGTGFQRTKGAPDGAPLYSRIANWQG